MTGISELPPAPHTVAIVIDACGCRAAEGGGTLRGWLAERATSGPSKAAVAIGFLGSSLTMLSESDTAAAAAWTKRKVTSVVFDAGKNQASSIAAPGDGSNVKILCVKILTIII